MAANKKFKVGINDDDRISSLPDDVLCHILSFLTTKYSVRTCVLSTRWKQLFTFVPILDFEYQSDTSNSNATTTNSFIHFVNSVLLKYNVSRMTKFRFNFLDAQEIQPPKNFPIISWMSSAIQRNVQEIDICSFNNIPLTLPLDLFSCKTLTILRLGGEFNVVLPRSLCLPSLRTCSLGLVRFDKESAQSLFRNCPVLEHLDLTGCIVGEGIKIFNISSPTLKNLTILECGSGANYQVMLNLPNLLRFSYVGPASYEFSGLDSLKSMVDAYVYYDPDSFTRNGVLVELIRSFCHVQLLFLNCDAMEAFIQFGHSLPKFNNLTSLILNIAPISSLASRLLPALLYNSPRLEFLTIARGYLSEHNGTGEDIYLLPEYVPECVSRHLKEVDFTFTGLDYERKLIKYFLKYSNNLEKLKIRSYIKWSEQYEISSVACQVILYSDDLEELVSFYNRSEHNKGTTN